MTQTIQVECCSVSVPAGQGALPRTNSPGAEADDSPFAQLLAIAQNLSSAGEQGQAVPVPADNLAPEQQQPPSAGEMEQAVALLGLPLFTANMLSAQLATLPEAHTPDAGTLRLPAQMAILPQVATDVSIAPSTPADTKESPEAEAIHQSPLHPDGELAALIAQKASNETNLAQQMPSGATIPPQHEVVPGDITDTVQTVASPATGARALPKDATEKPRSASEDLATAQGAPNAAVAPAQAGYTGQTPGEQRYERQDATPTTPRIARPQAKKQAVFEAIEKPTAHRPSEAHLHGVQGAEVTSVMHRAQETAGRPSDVSPAEVARQVARQIETMTSQRSTGSVTLQLEPEHLGKLRVTVSVSDGAIHTHIVADSYAVRQMLESNSSLLQQALQERGLQLGALQVSVQGDGRQFLLHQPHTPPPPARGWLEAEIVTGTSDETRFGWTTSAGVNLLA